MSSSLPTQAIDDDPRSLHVVHEGACPYCDDKVFWLSFEEAEAGIVHVDDDDQYVAPCPPSLKAGFGRTLTEMRLLMLQDALRNPPQIIGDPLSPHLLKPGPEDDEG